MNKHEKTLFERFRFFGRKHLEYRQKCIGMLPEIYREKIHEKKGFDSIFEFAAKFAGLSHEQVKRVLSLDEQFEDKPLLKFLLENGEASVNKLARVASVATAKNQEFWAAQVKLLPNRALETLVKDEKFAIATNQSDGQGVGGNQNGLQKAFFDQNFVHVHKVQHSGAAAGKSLMSENKELNLSREAKHKLLELQNKGIDINQLILEMLEKREEEIHAEKEKLSDEAKPTASRYIKVAVKNLMQKEYGKKCSIKGCKKPSEENHHLQRFGVVQIHDSKYMAPFCPDHHKIAHSIDVSYQEIRGRVLGR